MTPSSNIAMGTRQIFGSSETPKVLVVDDRPLSRLMAVDLLSNHGYLVEENDGSSDVMEAVLNLSPDLILLDIILPYSNGFDICKLIKQDRRTSNIPIILMTVEDESQFRLKSQEVKADGFLSKPLEQMVLLPEAELLIQRKRLFEWLEQIQQVLFLIAQANERRNSEGSRSSIRIDLLAQEFGNYLSLSPVEINDLILAAHLHDIGTLVIPDSILLKTDPLTEQERDLIEQHVLVGEQICQPMQNRRGIAQIIRHHHERWDGSGYPDGLKGEDIPWLAQVFQILDIYDALTRNRPYNDALSPDAALAVIMTESEKGWRNPLLVGQFVDFMRSPISRSR